MTGLAVARRMIVVLCATMLAPLAAAAQPAGRAITIVVPYTPGTGPDILARVLGDEAPEPAASAGGDRQQGGR